jgi:hypothetical protein
MCKTRTPKPIFDTEGRILASLAGQPSDDTYHEDTWKAHEAIQRAGQSMKFSQKETCHRRGNFPAKNVGVSYGMGQVEPDNVSCGIHKEALDGLIEEESIQRMAAYASGKKCYVVLNECLKPIPAAFALWAPKVHGYYKKNLDALFDRLPHLK